MVSAKILLFSSVACGLPLWLDWNDIQQQFHQIFLISTNSKSSIHKELLPLSSSHKTVTLVPYDKFLNWIKVQQSLSFDRILENILPNGAVIASPSKEAPNYYYQWIRDAGITINTIVSEYTDSGATNGTLQSFITSYIHNSLLIQREDNPSGPALDTGLGEPKFEVDNTPFWGNWGRPQRDGPALRAIAIINYLKTFKSDENRWEMTRIFRDVIKYDLEYIARYWRMTGFDLWEEVHGSHFFTAMVQRRALVEGAKMAKDLGYFFDSIYYEAQAQLMSAYIRVEFYDTSRGHIVETAKINTRSGLDSALFLGSLHGLIGNPAWDIYEPWSEDILISLYYYLNSLRSKYPINVARLNDFQYINNVNATLVGFGVGRYPEDIYDGTGTSLGNPWFLCTATVANILYNLVEYLSDKPPEFKYVISERTLPLLGSFVPGFNWDSSQIVLLRKEEIYEQFMFNLMEYGDSFIDVIREHVDSEGHMSEQFSRYDGFMKGARDLTWSYGAFWEALRQRDRVYKKFL